MHITSPNNIAPDRYHQAELKLDEFFYVTWLKTMCLKPSQACLAIIMFIATGLIQLNNNTCIGFMSKLIQKKTTFGLANSPQAQTVNRFKN